MEVKGVEWDKYRIGLLITTRLVARNKNFNFFHSPILEALYHEVYSAILDKKFYNQKTVDIVELSNFLIDKYKKILPDIDFPFRGLINDCVLFFADCSQKQAEEEKEKLLINLNNLTADDFESLEEQINELKNENQKKPQKKIYRTLRAGYRALPGGY